MKDNLSDVEANWSVQWDVEGLYKQLLTRSAECDDQWSVQSSGSSIVCGPCLRLIELNYEKKKYRGSLMLVVVGNVEMPKVTFLKGNPNAKISDKGEFDGKLFHTDNLDNVVVNFYRYAVDFDLIESECLVRYAVDDICMPHYRVYIPSSRQNTNTIAYSCNGFSLSVDTTVFKGSLWYDILMKHSKVHYHVMLGGGDQIYSDQIKLYCEPVKNWLGTKDPIKKYGTTVDEGFRADLDSTYLREYIQWYGSGYWKGGTEKSRTTQSCFPIAMASIPSINMWDDHDIIDGFGSYSDKFMKTSVFSSIGKSAYKYYMLFQHHTSMNEQVPYLEDSSWILGAAKSAYIEEKSHSIFTQLGPDVSLLSVDCRTERKLKQILSTQSYDLIFERIQNEYNKTNYSHLLVMLGIPIAYPRLVWLEWLFSSKLLKPLRWLSQKGIFAKALVNDFNGDVELLDDLNDHWCAHNHKSERNTLISRLQDFGAKNGVRITILSGDVHLASIGRFRSKSFSKRSDEDVRLMFNIISSAVCNTPPPDNMVKLLQKKDYKTHQFDNETIEDAVPIFNFEASDDSKKKAYDSFYNNRNWSDIIPVQNAMNNEYLKTTMNLQINKLAMPKKMSGKGFDCQDTILSDKNFIPYEIRKKGLLATIHIEKDKSNMDSETSFYSLPIPELTAKNNSLSHKGAKHLSIHRS